MGRGTAGSLNQVPNNATHKQKAHKQKKQNVNNTQHVKKR